LRVPGKGDRSTSSRKAIGPPFQRSRARLPTASEIVTTPSFLVCFQPPLYPRAARPHGFRHSSITTGLERVKDPRKVQKHGRHASIDTTMIYDDALSDFAGEVAKVVSEALEE
jgi:integrase